MHRGVTPRCARLERVVDGRMFRPRRGALQVRACTPDCDPYRSCIAASSAVRSEHCRSTAAMSRTRPPTGVHPGAARPPTLDLPGFYPSVYPWASALPPRPRTASLGPGTRGDEPEPSRHNVERKAARAVPHPCCGRSHRDVPRNQWIGGLATKARAVRYRAGLHWRTEMVHNAPFRSVFGGAFSLPRAGTASMRQRPSAKAARRSP